MVLRAAHLPIHVLAGGNHVRSIPIISRQDYLYPSHMAPFPCGEGNASWNTVAASPFAKEVSVGSWDDLPELLERLKEAPAEYIDNLQVGGVERYQGPPNPSAICCSCHVFL